MGDFSRIGKVTGMGGRDQDRFPARRWPDWSFRRTRRQRVTTIAVNAAAVLGLTAQVAEIDHENPGGVRSGIAFAALGCYAAGYLYVLWSGPSASRRRRGTLVAAVFALGAVPAVVLGSPDYLTELTYAVALGLMLLPLRWSLPLGFATVAGQITWMALGTGHVTWSRPITLAGVTIALGTVFALIFTIGHLQAAREQVRNLAVTRERERVARDLHDILGHNLSTMSLKLGLARRILESPGSPEPALAEIRDLENLCHQSLSDVRATVSGYREVTLDTELAGARAALRAAGVRAELPGTAADVDPALRGVFGYVVREAVTNVLRHSDATRCQVRLGPGWVEVTDDGTATADAAPGHGLTGLTERLTAVSGALEHGRGPRGGFRVYAEVPA